MSNGLSEKLIEFDVDDDFIEVKEKIESNYAKLAGIGGYEFLRVKRSSRDLAPILASENGYDAKTLITGIGKGRLYLRPIQEKIHLIESTVNLKCMPEEICRICNTKIATFIC